MRKHRRQLDARALGRQDHTISLSASAPIVTWHIRVHRIPASRLVTFAIRPSENRGGMVSSNADFQQLASRIFLREDLERASPFDSSQQISICAHAALIAQARFESTANVKANGFCLSGKPLCVDRQ